MEYLVHNGSRSTATRMVRASQPRHGGHKQFVCGNDHRLVRGRPVALTEEKLQEHLEELRTKASKGLIYVTTRDGRPFDLADLKPLEARRESPLPNPPLDSAARDINRGSDMTTRPGEPAIPKVFVMPVEPPAAAVDNNPVVATTIPAPPQVVEEVVTETSTEVPVEADPEVQAEAPAPVQSSKSQYGGKQNKYDKRR